MKSVSHIPDLRDLDLDLGSGHMAYHHMSLIDLYLYTKFRSNWKHFLWTDGQTYTDRGRDGQRDTDGLIRSTGRSGRNKFYDT